VEVLTDRPTDRFRPGAVLHAEGSDDALTVASSAPVADGPGWRLVFREVTDRTQAEALQGVYLEAVVNAAAHLSRGEYYWHEVIGSAVRTTDGEELGRVEDLYRVGETEVLLVRGGPRGELDIPVVRSLIRIFAPRRGEIVVDAALLELPSGPAKAGRPAAPRRRPRRRATMDATAGDSEPIGDSTPAGDSVPGGDAVPGRDAAPAPNEPIERG
jgi:16S rRNA processing protein RimM